MEVKLLPQDGELYVFAQSADRVAKERAMRKRQLKWLWKRLGELAAMKQSRNDLLMKLGAAHTGPRPGGASSPLRLTTKKPASPTDSIATSCGR